MRPEEAIMMKPHVSGITLEVEDVDGAKRFYSEGLGWPVGR
jgi:predicted enzyme related to lactoylglutathione lyase